MFFVLGPRVRGDDEQKCNVSQTSPWLGGAKLDRCGPFPQAACANGRAFPNVGAMEWRQKWAKFLDSPVVEWSMFVAGILLILAGLAIAPVPGPGGIFLIAPGIALILKTSMWAKRHYVRVKRWQPKAGRWMDWALRRPSAQRREAIRKAADTPNRN